ncbi:hypothetical protein K474DRAFT_1662016 [Panus rudis PR-1116 ss-1]|nr:hypothetical protein K474DRAFT_1662016 [Panus rudis PR-1116 ss-1]
MPPKAPVGKPVTKTTQGQPKKKTPKQPLPVSDRLKRLFSSLCAQVDGGHFANAIKTCDKILRLAPDDTDALQTKLFLLLQTERYGDALALIDAQPQFAFEKAYSLYRLHQEDEAAEMLRLIKAEKGEDDRGVIHLEAQLNYRQGSYQKASDLYNDLLDNTEPDTEEHSDILTNLEAVQKHLDFINSGYLRSLDTAGIAPNLESLPPPPPPQSTSAIIAASTSAAVTGENEQKKAAAPKKVRAKRVPPGVIPGVTPPPDPERWLKKSERSTFHAGHKKRKGGGGATQGIV